MNHYSLSKADYSSEMVINKSPVTNGNLFRCFIHTKFIRHSLDYNLQPHKYEESTIPLC